MAKRKATRWQKASAIVPMAILVGAWGAALTNTGLASASGGIDDVDVPDVPSTAFEQPASVSRGSGIDPKAGLDGTLSTLSSNGIPAAAMSAYRRAESLLDRADASCKLPWHLVAAIGRVESNHGRIGGSSINDEGVASPGVFGIALNGDNNTQRITDTDSGALDNDRVFDRAVGPMQFIPQTWKSVGVDSDGDDKKNPQDIDDASAAAGVYLCAGAGDLSERGDAASAVRRYNRSTEYVNQVLAISEAYKSGDFTQTPNGQRASTILTNMENDQTLTAGERQQVRQANEKKKADAKKKQEAEANGGGGSSGGGSDTGGGDSGGGSDTGGGGLIGGGDTGGGDDSSSGVGSSIQEEADKTPVAKVTKPVTDVVTEGEAKVICIAEDSLLKLNLLALDKCIADTRTDQ